MFNQQLNYSKVGYETLTPVLMLSWFTSVMDIYLDNGWYKAVQESLGKIHYGLQKMEPILFL